MIQITSVIAIARGANGVPPTAPRTFTTRSLSSSKARPHRGHPFRAPSVEVRSAEQLGRSRRTAGCSRCQPEQDPERPTAAPRPRSPAPRASMRSSAKRCSARKWRPRPASTRPRMAMTSRSTALPTRGCTSGSAAAGTQPAGPLSRRGHPAEPGVQNAKEADESGEDLGVLDLLHADRVVRPCSVTIPGKICWMALTRCPPRWGTRSRRSRRQRRRTPGAGRRTGSRSRSRPPRDMLPCTLP